MVCPRAFEQISSFNVLIFIYGRSAYAVVLVWRSEKDDEEGKRSKRGILGNEAAEGKTQSL